MRIGRWELRGEIARGGMGAVYRGYDRETGRDAAVKVLIGGDSERLRRRFRREAEAILKLDHPHIVPAIEWGEDKGNLFMALELVPGETLADRLDRAGALRPQEAARTLRTVARALEHAHGRGILHRDLKPANILLDPELGAMLTDFGLARELDASQSALSRSGVGLGTPGYWPPEQAVGDLDALSPASDVYALGATLYAALSGSPPLSADSVTEAIAATLTQRPEPTGVDPALDAVCLRCLEKKPEDRYPSAAAVADVLEQYLAGELEAPKRAPWGALGAVAAFVVGGIALAAWLLGHDPAPPQPELRPWASASQQGIALYKQGAYAEALPHFDRAIELKPDDATYHYNRGMCRLRAGDRAGSLTDFRQSTVLEPKQVKAWLAVGQLLNEAEEFAEALDAFARVHASDPDHAQASVGRGSALHGLERYEESLEAYDRAVAADPTLHNAWGGRGTTLEKLERYERAVADYSAALGLSGPSAEWLFGRGLCLGRLGRWAEAEEDLTRTLELGEAPLAYVHRGHARLSKQPRDVHGALADYERAVELFGPDDPRSAQVQKIADDVRAALGGG